MLNKNTPPVPLPHGGTKEVGGGRSEFRGLLVFFDIDTCFVNCFDHNGTLTLGLIAPARVENMISSFASTGNPDDAILALNCHAILIVQVKDFARLKEQLDPWGF